jgi:two-component system, LuxR family, response regulator FixJ
MSPPFRRRGPGPLTMPNIVVVDDDPDVLSSLKFLFESEGCRVSAFADGGSLLAEQIDEELDCLVVDFAMPGMNGLELIETLRARNVTTPAVLISGRQDDRIERRAQAQGVRFVRKPHLEESLMVAVLSALQAANRIASDLR